VLLRLSRGRDGGVCWFIGASGCEIGGDQTFDRLAGWMGWEGIGLDRKVGPLNPINGAQNDTKFTLLQAIVAFKPVRNEKNTNSAITCKLGLRITIILA